MIYVTLLLISEDQFDVIENAIKGLNWYILISYVIDRKGTDVAIMLCTKSEEIYNQMKETVETIENVY